MEIHLAEYIKAPEKLGRDSLDELRQLVEKYPYFQPARLLYLRNLYQLHDASFDKELRRASLFLPDRTALFLFIEGHNYCFELGSRYETASIETADEDRTNSLIDNFLSKLPEEKEKGRRQKPVDISTDYMAYLMQTGDMQDIVAPRMQHQDLIDDFIGHGDRRIVLAKTSDEEFTPPASVEQDNGATEENEDYFTETLAKIYIKQGRYIKAMEIIRKLSLKYPKKNRYFADQIRFLEKLIINNKNKNS